MYTPLFPEWSDLAERAQADRESYRDNRTLDRPRIVTSSSTPQARGGLIAARASALRKLRAFKTR